MNFFEHIDEYLDQVLSDELMTQFEDELKKNVKLQEELAETRQIRSYIQSQLKKEHTKEFLETLPEKEGRIVPLKKWLFSVAAALLLLVCATLFVANQKFSNQALMADYTYEPSLKSVRGDASEAIAQVNSLWQNQQWNDVVAFCRAPERIKSRLFSLFARPSLY